jgi:transposase
MSSRVDQLRPSRTLPRVILYRHPVDFRKSYRGLAAVVEFELDQDPTDGTLYVFVNRHHNRIKIVFWERNGFVLYYKALSEDRFVWPVEQEDQMSLDGEALNWLLDGVDLRAIKPHKTLENRAFF